MSGVDARRIGLVWSGGLLLAVLLLPWFKGGGGSALTQALEGRAWLMPLIAIGGGLALLSAMARDWRIHPAGAVLVGAGLVWLILQGFAIGLRGPAIAGLEALFPTSALGQPGFGWGAWIAGIALIGALADLLAGRGFCRGERFAALSIIGIVAALSLFVFFPILRLVATAFVAADGTVSLAPFAARLTAPDLWALGCLTGAGRCGVVINSVILGVLSATLATALGLALALLVARTDFRLKRLLRALSILPIITPPFVVGVAIIVLFGRTGIVTVELAELMGIRPTRWIYGLPGILMAQVLAFAPVTFLVILSALEAINPTLEEASTTLGARPVTTFRRVTWPLLRPALAAAFLLAFIESLSDFGNPIVLGGSYDVLSTRIFFAVVGAQYDLGHAATLSLILLALTVGAFWVQQRWVGRASYVTVTGKSDAGLTAAVPPLVKWAAIAAVVPFVVFTTGIYAIVLVGGFVGDIARMDLTPTIAHVWTAFSFEITDRGVQLFGSAWNSMITTLWVSALSAPLTMGIGILTAWLITRQDFTGKRLFEFGTLLSFAVPGTVVGVSYIAAFNVPPIDITGTLWILVICFVFRNMAVGMRAGVAALAQIDRSMEEASQTMGAGGGRVMVDVVLPLIKPAIFTALVYAFVTAMTAVSAVIFLVSARHNMATAYIMGRVENGEFALAIAYSTVLMLVMMACIALMNLGIGRRKLGRRSALSKGKAT
ncbi:MULTISPECIES: iron ABC transporter permease [Paracoccus]|uniref:ABC transporter permease n=1 Tax=Paracoccus TaxID=265 RepID=UPI00086F3D58|nr:MULTISPECIES: iron ABC transporter permease [Paracoccus]ODT58315.1 MAG: iron ABC transporter permease [Paracoccus sp. SCN 68-21]